MKQSSKASKSRQVRKTQKSTATPSQVNAAASAFETIDTEEIASDNLSSVERQLLARVARFLCTVTVPSTLRRAVRAGYTREEHRVLWQLFSAAAGREQSLEIGFQLAGEQVGGGERLALLQEIDSFENVWFPRMRAIIARQVAAESTQAFAAAFFRDLSQQPLGPLVVDSVSTFLDRVSELESSTLPNAQAVLATLRQRGLTQAAEQEMRGKLERARTGLPAVRSSLDSATLKAVQASQQTALRDLRLAWLDWATTLRPLYDVREQIQLGLTDAKVRAEADASEAEPSEPQKAQPPTAANANAAPRVA